MLENLILDFKSFASQEALNYLLAALIPATVSALVAYADERKPDDAPKSLLGRLILAWLRRYVARLDPATQGRKVAARRNKRKGKQEGAGYGSV